jgi:hypothetical protein
MGLLDNTAEGRRAGERHLPSVACAGQLQPIEAGNEVPYSLVCGAAVNLQQARKLPVHSQQSAALLRIGRQSGERSAGGSVAPGLPAGCAIHGQRPVSTGHQEQGRPDRNLGARQCERLCLPERPAHGNRNRAASADRRRRPGRQSLYRRPLSADRQWHAAAHSAGEPIRDCGDHSGRRRARSGDAGARRRRTGAHRPRRALHQQWNGQSSDRAGQP